MSAKNELKKYIDTMSDEDVKIVLSFFKRFIYREGPPLSAKEAAAFKRSAKEIANGEYVTLEEFEQSKRI